MICLNGFDKNTNDENKISTDDKSSEPIIDLKNKIQSILVNKIMNNLKSQKNMKILMYFIIQVKKNNTFSGKYIKQNYKYLSGKKL